MKNDLIVVKQLPVIEEQLREVQAGIQSRVNEALSLVCTEETYKEIKAVRAEFNKEFAELESRRKQVKASILKPYERFEAVYKACVGDIYLDADKKLKARIAEVENGLKQQKEDEVTSYYAEYRTSLGLDADLVPFSRAGIKITLSESKKSLKSRAKEFLDGIAGDLSLIATLENKDEVLVEYRKTLSVSSAVTTVADRHKAMEAERQRREAAAAAQAEREKAARSVQSLVEEEAPLEIPSVVPAPEAVPDEAADSPDEKIFEVHFAVKGTRRMLKALKEFMKNGGYEYADI